MLIGRSFSFAEGKPFGFAQGKPFDFAQGLPFGPLRAGKIRSLSGAEAPDFLKECNKLLRPSASLRVNLRLRSGSKNL